VVLAGLSVHMDLRLTPYETDFRPCRCLTMLHRETTNEREEVVTVDAGVSDSVAWVDSIVDVALVFLVQADVASILFGILLAISVAWKPLLPWLLHRWRLRALFFVATVLALPAYPLVLARPVGYTGVILTAVLALLFFPLTHAFIRYLGTIQAKREVVYPAAGRIVPNRSVHRTRPAPEVRTPADTPDSLLYRNLVRKTFGDRAAADRLINYERKHFPFASQSELIQRAIERWERDNRR